MDSTASTTLCISDTCAGSRNTGVSANSCGAHFLAERLVQLTMQLRQVDDAAVAVAVESVGESQGSCHTPPGFARGQCAQQDDTGDGACNLRADETW